MINEWLVSVVKKYEVINVNLQTFFFDNVNFQIYLFYCLNNKYRFSVKA